jgi:hypothetical protein
MTLRVRSRGPVVPSGPVSGEVVHASGGALYLAWAGGGPLSALHGPACGTTPWSVIVEGLGRADDWAHPGDPAAVRAGRLRAGRLVVALPPAGPCAPRPSGGLRALAPEAVRAALARVGGTGALDAPERLVGLGPGLTPSGDDVLTGALCVLWAAGPAAKAQRDALADVARTAAGRTTRVGAHQLAAAADGWFAEALLAVVDAPTDAVAARCAAVLLGVGATSGADLLAGAVLAVDALATSAVAA